MFIFTLMKIVDNRVWEEIGDRELPFYPNIGTKLSNFYKYTDIELVVVDSEYDFDNNIHYLYVAEVLEKKSKFGE